MNSIYSQDVSAAFTSWIDFDNIQMQSFKDKKKRNALGFGQGSGKLISFEMGLKDNPIKGVVCS